MNKRKAKKILKQYGKAAYKARIQYVDSFLEKNPSAIRKISYRHMLKRCMMVAAILILTFALLVTTASALGIHIFNFSFFEKSDHTTITSNEKTNLPERIIKFYDVEYVPNGYQLIAEEAFGDIELEYIYESPSGELLYIDQNIADGYVIDINNENCKIRKKTLQNIELVIYDYGNRKTYLFQYQQTHVRIKGSLEDKEFEKIILNMAGEQLNQAF